MLRDYLAGFEPKQPQIVGNMAVIPLVNSEREFSGIAGAENVKLKSDPDYGLLELMPLEDELTIVPNGYTIITKEKAQDRTVPAVHVLQKNKTVQAFCVQSSQSGHMSPNNNEQQSIHLLPLAIRHHAHTVYKNKKDIGALWGKLGEMNRELGVGGDYLVSFFNRFEKDLDQFVAQFEPIPKQRGAIVLINNRVVGIDIMPSPQTFLKIWEMLIRDCYGAEAIRQQKDADVTPISKLSEVNSINQLLDAVNKMAEEEKKWAYGIVKAVLDQDEMLEKESSIKTKQFGTLSVKKMITDELEGQAILDKDGHAVYLSLFRYVVKRPPVKAFPI